MPLPFEIGVGRGGHGRSDEAHSARGHAVGTFLGGLAIGTRGDDELHVESAPGIALGGRGDDVVTFTPFDSFWPFSSILSGGRGHDTLILDLSASDWADDAIRQEVSDFLAHLDSGSNRTFYFNDLRMFAQGFEVLEVMVDGVPVDLGDTPPDIIDQGDSTDDLAIETGEGDDQVTTGSGNDTVSTGGGNDTISSGSGNDVITPGDGDDSVFAGAGNDTIIAGNGGGNDFIDGGAGLDTVTYPSVNTVDTQLDPGETLDLVIDLEEIDRSGNADVVAILARPEVGLAADTPVGLATGDAIDTDVLVGIEIAIGGEGNDQISGSAADNLLDGGAGDGADTLNGRGGSDTLLGGAGNDVLDGGDGNDFLEGGAGDDAINGGFGFDTLILSGNLDEYSFESLPDGSYRVIDSVAGRDGTDTIRSVESLVFSDQTVEIWTVTGTNEIFSTATPPDWFGTDGRDRFFGSTGDDNMYGLGEEDEFLGGPGDDLFDGGLGTDDDANFVLDSVHYGWDAQLGADAGFAVSGVVVNLETGFATDPFGDTDSLVDIERVFGTGFSDVLIGSDQQTEFFDPGGGDDEIHGGAGRDSLNYHLDVNDGATLGIVVLFSETEAGAGTVLQDSFGDTDTFTGIEALRGTSFDDVVIGGAGTQEVRLLDGADRFDGGDGFDLVDYSAEANYGGSGGIDADLEILDADGYGRVMDGFGAVDWIRNVEFIRGTGAEDAIRGDGNDNEFRGEAGNDLLEGRGGDDLLQGGLGNDLLDGGAGEDELSGEQGDDTLIGGAGNDYMIGGFGADTFVFGLGDGNDTIEDFEVGLDRVQLEEGVTVVGLAELDDDGDGSLDTEVELSSGGYIILRDVVGVTDADELLI